MTDAEKDEFNRRLAVRVSEGSLDGMLDEAREEYKVGSLDAAIRIYRGYAKIVVLKNEADESGRDNSGIK